MPQQGSSSYMRVTSDCSSRQRQDAAEPPATRSEPLNVESQWKMPSNGSAKTRNSLRGSIAKLILCTLADKLAQYYCRGAMTIQTPKRYSRYQAASSMIAGAGSLLVLMPPNRITSPEPSLSEPTVLRDVKGIYRGFANAARHVRGSYESKITHRKAKG